MEAKVWDVKEQFLFPASFGVPREVKKVEVTPQFETNETKDSIQIVGIYHITCHVAFEEGEHTHHATSEFTQIEDLDVQGEVGYFEYAVPMTVDIPKEKIRAGNAPSLSVRHVHSAPTDHASIEIAWSVHCEYEAPEKVKTVEKVEAVEKAEAIEKIEKVEKVVELVESSNMVDSELQFILNLDDGMSKLTFPSNYVSVKQKAEE